MTDDEYKAVTQKYLAEKARFESLKPGDFIYERGEWGDCFKHEVVHVDVANRKVYTKDHSLKGKPSVLPSWWTLEEVRSW